MLNYGRTAETERRQVGFMQGRRNNGRCMECINCCSLPGGAVLTTACCHRRHPCAAHIPLFLYPFLNTVSKTRPFEYLRLTSLGVIGALVKVDDTEVINFLLSTEIIPLCLRTMETGSELSKTVATFIVQKILLDNVRAGGGAGGAVWARCLGKDGL